MSKQSKQAIVSIAIITLLVLTIFGCKDKGERRWTIQALHSFDKLVWEDGRGSFEGGKVAVVGTDLKTGAIALFLKMPPKKLEEAHGGRLHSHTSTSHTLILEGEVSAIINDKKFTGKAGDYFRFPAGLAHTGSETGPLGATMFMITEGKFDLEFTKKNQQPMEIGEIKGEKRWNLPALHTLNDLIWEEGSGSLEGGKVAMVGKDSKSGAMALFLRMPAKKMTQAHEGRLHYHTSTSHTIIFKGGTVSAMINSKTMVGKTFDYFRMPAGFPHKGSGTIVDIPGSDVMMFMITDGEFGIQFAKGISQ